MISYQDICRANETLKFSDIKGKNYAEVPQRVKAFRMLYPQGFIITDMVSNEGGVCVFKATAGYYGENGEAYTLGTGTAYEKENSSYINKTSYIENCETSAVGRALGFLNIGSDTSIASYEEVQNAINNQEQPEKQEKAKPEPYKPAFDVMPMIKSYCEQNELTGNEFTQLRNTCIEMGNLPRIAYNAMDEQQALKMLEVITLFRMSEAQSA